jgi:predicted DNA-binding transcriptional regulator AlpA
MNKFTKLLRDLLVERIEAIDAGNSNLDEESAIAILKTVSDSTNMTKRVSKYKACQILCISRATFDNYVREGKLPQGEHTIGFKEKSWSMYDINKFKETYWNK